MFSWSLKKNVVRDPGAQSVVREAEQTLGDIALSFRRNDRRRQHHEERVMHRARLLRQHFLPQQLSVGDGAVEAIPLPCSDAVSKDELRREVLRSLDLDPESALYAETVEALFSDGPLKQRTKNGSERVSDSQTKVASDGDV